MDGIARNAQYRTLREEPARDVEATLGNDTGEAHGRCGVQPKGFVDDCLEIRKSFDDFRGCDRVVVVPESFVEFCLELRLDSRVRGEIVGDGTRGAGTKFK